MLLYKITSVINKNFLKRNSGTLLAYGVLIIIFILFLSNQPDAFTRYGFQSIFNQVIVLVTASLAQTVVVLTGGIDLSVGALIAMTNAITAMAMGTMIVAVGNEVTGVILLTLVVILIGAVSGALNGILVAIGRIQAIIVTLATSMIFMGISIIVCPTPGGKVSRLFSRGLTGFLGTTVPWRYIPVSALVLVILVFVIWMPLRNRRFFQNIYAVGGNEYSAYVSGINIIWTRMTAYILAGVFSGFGGLLITAQTATGNPLGAEPMMINSVAAVVLGGVALTGGKGTFIGAMAGAVSLSLILGLLIFWRVPSFYQSGVRGMILIVALAMNIFMGMKKRSKKSGLLVKGKLRW
jgi:ribose transport system permease protein